MRIVIDFSGSQYRLTPNEIFFLDNCFQLLVKDQPQHEWVIEPFAETKGAISLLPLGIKKSLLLEKINPRLLITTAELKKKSLTALKQIFFYYQSYESYNKEKKSPRNASLVITTSPNLREKIIKSNRLEENNVIVIPAAPSEDITVADWSEKLSVKDKYSDGREFFFSFKKIGPNTQWEELLKAFSIFKRWQQSSFRLLIAGEIEPGFSEAFYEKFNSYKYRNDVKIIDPDIGNIESILPSAFGLICADADYTGIGMLNGFKTEVPVISSPVDLFDEEVSGAFIPAIPQADELSRQLINLYRDESMREIMIEKGKEVVKKFSWEQSVGKWVNCLQAD